MNKIRIALCQMLVSNEKEENIIKAEKMINKSVEEGAQLVVLPEMFNCPYDNSFFPLYAEEYPEGKTITRLAEIAKEKRIYLVGGSIPERDKNGNIYNTSFIFDKEGKLLGRHRKVHLFDIDIKDKIRFMESEVLGYGNEPTVVNTEYGPIGIAICYDIRFPELIRLMVLKGAKIIIIPAAFNMTTGPAHWEILFKARALDNQAFIVGAAPARNEESAYVSYGNSIVTNPWGEIVSKLDEKEGILIQDLDLKQIDVIREELPLLKHRREDIYKFV